MIYLGFILDYLITYFLPIKTYFILVDIDNNKLYYVIIIGFLLDVMFRSFSWYLIILLSLYLITRLFKLKGKDRLFMNIIIFCLFFNFTYFMFGYDINFYIRDLLWALLLQIIYMIGFKVLFR